MSGMLCSEEYLLFSNIIGQISLELKDFNPRAREALKHLEEVAHLGKMELFMNGRTSVFEPAGIDTSAVLFESEKGFGNDVYNTRYETPGNSTVDFWLYPYPGYVWNDEEKRELEFLTRQLFLISGRGRLLFLLNRASVMDTATGISNAAGLIRFGAFMAKEGRLHEYNGLFINIRNFNYFNQRVGSYHADSFLYKYAQKLRLFVLEDEGLGRLGGDDFFVFIKKTRMGVFQEYLDDIQVDMEKQNGETECFEIKVRAGVYDINEGDEPGTVIERASLALANAKRQTEKSFVWYSPEMLERDMRFKHIVMAFPNALAKKEFVAYYQPKVALNGNILCGCEALTRWVKDGELVPPADFIPALEQEGSVCELDYYILDKVCEDIRNWLDAGIEPVPVSVNFSKHHFRDRNFISRVIGTIRKYHLDPKYIEVELTENTSFGELQQLEAFMKEMKANQIPVSIDDFGTGYSSLNLLRSLDADIIKIDKSFIDMLEENDTGNEILIKNIINMINELGKSVVAEGVETAKQANFLRDAGCAVVQGFLFDKPMDLDAFTRRLTGSRKYE